MLENRPCGLQNHEISLKIKKPLNIAFHFFTFAVSFWNQNALKSHSNVTTKIQNRLF